jgi:hypothetical protein
MTEIALMVCAVSSLAASVGGGFYFMREQGEKNKEKQRIDTAEARVFGQKVIAYYECDYAGEDRLEIGGTPDFVEMEGGFENPLKSIVIPKGYTVDTYSKENQEGVKKSYTGPHTERCISFHSLHVRKE